MKWIVIKYFVVLFDKDLLICFLLFVFFDMSWVRFFVVIFVVSEVVLML